MYVIHRVSRLCMLMSWFAFARPK